MKFQCACGHIFRMSEGGKESFQVYDDSGTDVLIRELVLLHSEPGDANDFEDRVINLLTGLKFPVVDMIECPLCLRLNVVAKQKLRAVYKREEVPNSPTTTIPRDLRTVFLEVKKELSS